MKVAALDIGSYTLKMAIGTVSAEGGILLLGDFSQDSRLIDGLDEHGRLAADSIEECVRLVDSYRRMLRAMGGVETIQAVATSALRDAVNKDDFCTEVESRTGVPVTVLPADEESAYVYVSSHDVAPAVPEGKVVVADVGAGSTEFAVGHAEGLLGVKSYGQGAARIAQKFLSQDDLPPEQFIKACEYIDEQLDLTVIQDLLGDSPYRIIACGSTASGLSALEEGLPTPDRRLTHAREVPFDAMFAWYEHLLEVPQSELDEVTMLAGPRGRVFLGGLALWLFILEKLGATSLIVSDNGVRHGLLRELLGLERSFE